MGLRKHLALSNASLCNHSRSQDFYTSRFTCLSGAPYLCWRVVWAAYHLAWSVAGPLLAARDVVHSRDDGAVAIGSDDGGSGGDGADAAAGKWFIYLSHWVYLILTMDCILEVAMVVRATKGRRPKVFESRDSHLSCLERLVWLLSTVSVTGSVMICLWYWTMLYKGKELTGARVNTHGVAALYCILDLLLSRKPFRLLHFLYPVLFGAAYTAFSALYQFAGGQGRDGSPVIYPVLDWSSAPWRTLIISSISNFLVIPVVHVAVWALGIVFTNVGVRCDGGDDGGDTAESKEGESRKSGRYDRHVDTETSSCVGTSSSAGNSRCSRLYEELEGSHG